jgi:hypothetical protein
MGTSTPKHEPLLTLDDVRAKRRAIVGAEAEIARISAQLEADIKEFQQMLVFVPKALRDRIMAEDPSPAPDLFTSPVLPAVRPPSPKAIRAAITKAAPVRDGSRSQGHEFSNFITDLVNKSPAGISHAELKAAVESSPHAHRLDDQAKAYYRTVGKLVAREKIVRHGLKFYSSSVYEVLKKTGELPQLEEGVSLRENSAARITLEVLQKHANGLSGPDLKVLVGADPDAPRSVTEHGQYIYNVLATLIGTGRVEKHGSLYRVVDMARPRVNGASVSTASGPAR